MLNEQNASTTMVNTVLYESREARDSVMQSGMESGGAVSYDRLAALLPPA